MGINYWHRRPGLYNGEPGIYHKAPYNPDFWFEARLEFPSLRYDQKQRASWVPDALSKSFERYGLEHQLGTPCPRCRRGEYCTGWGQEAGRSAPPPPPESPPPKPPESKGFDPTRDFSDILNELFRGQYVPNFGAEYFRGKQAENAYQQKAQHDVRREQEAQWQAQYQQYTYGRRVDPEYDDLRRHAREENERRRRERAEHARANDYPIMQPPDVRRRAANLLGVSLSADKREIKNAVRKLALTHHPDRGGSTDKMSEILEARRVLLGR
jgi:hypothetical protein